MSSAAAPLRTEPVPDRITKSHRASDGAFLVALGLAELAWLAALLYGLLLLLG